MPVRAGEFWYDLNLTALPPPVHTTPLVKAAVGSVQGFTVPVENPTSAELVLSISSTNPQVVHAANMDCPSITMALITS